tara:strand:+ start:1005 stop:1706 length:702 start_codon:yes stop_codon:yes gene_type:complete
MIDTVYQLLKTIVNKELRGNVSPAEFNLIAKQAQDRIFRGYFEDANRDKNRQNKGLASKNYANLPLFQRQKIEQFSAQATLVPDNPGDSDLPLPTNLYFIKDRGISINGNVIDETEASDISFLSASKAGPSETFPVYEQTQGRISILPTTISAGVICRYLKIPSNPKWTYQIVSNIEMFDSGQSDYQDFELHSSEFTNIVIIMLSYFGINIREAEVTKYAEELRKMIHIKEEN